LSCSLLSSLQFPEVISVEAATLKPQNSHSFIIRWKSVALPAMQVMHPNKQRTKHIKTWNHIQEEWRLSKNHADNPDAIKT
jgi:hypothetical protein